MPKMDRILLTGCSGYIGRAFVPYLKRKGHFVLGFDRRPYEGTHLDGFIQGDLLDNASLRRSLDHIDMVMHLAAAKDDWGLSDEEYFRDNVLVTRELLRLAGEAGVRKWVFYSSVAVMGPSWFPLNEAAPVAPTTAYGTSKAQAETLFHELANKEASARILIIRPSVVFGPGNPPNTNIHRLIEAIYDKRFVMVGQGDAIKATSYVENLIEATLFLMQSMQQGVQTFIYVDEPKLSTAELVRQICSLLKKNPPQWSIPLSVAIPLAYLFDIVAVVTRKDFPITAARIKKFCSSTNFDANAIRKMGFEQPVSFEEGLRRTVQWYVTARSLACKAQ